MLDWLFSAPAYKGYGKTMVDQTYDQAGSPITVGLKDANLIQAAADLARVSLPSFNVYRDRLLGAVAHGDGDKDQAALAREQARSVRPGIAAGSSAGVGAGQDCGVRSPPADGRALDHLDFPRVPSPARGAPLPFRYCFRAGTDCGPKAS